MEKLSKIKNIIFSFVCKHIEICTILLLALVFYFIFFYNIGAYPLMDVDETRYVAMSRDMFRSKDFMTLYLNGHYFFEKPPLYFWQECLSFKLFGGVINEFSARFPVALLGFVFSFVVYFTSKHWVNRRFGIYTSLILATSLQFIILAKYAILDIVLTFYVGLALCCYFAIFFCKENHKKYYRWLFYIFTGLAVMAKGIPGIAIPVGCVFFISIFTKKFKEIFKPKYFFVGIVLFCLIVLPWHIYMFKIHNPLFFREYIIKHHIERFLNSHEIGRKQPFYYYFLILSWGFIPWIFSAITTGIERIKNQVKNKYYEKYLHFDTLDNTHKLIYMSWICVFWIMLFFSISSTKLPTYILSVYYPLAIIMGLVWKDYSEQKQHTKAINISVVAVGIFAISASILAIFTPLFLPKTINCYITDLKTFLSVVLFIFGVCSLIFVKKKFYKGVFCYYVLLMIVVSAFGTEKFYELDYKFGQNELIEFAQYAQKNNYTISTKGLNRKYSLLFYNDEPVDYNNKNESVKNVQKDLNKKKNYVILKKKDYEKIEKQLNCKKVKQGRRYVMIKGF
ncbi:MAG TPA: hypothetical protein DEO94_05980 [Cyanobacteria bacterium UBA11991]|nr:glycosyltransferase family 39 protein [Cyanobacteriota bacterium]MDY6357911.1 glycosyltransferase family 39 protein [Cyanobacteriota bacterium]MDY6364866.1 glycosyltransferase family 39 protein [Cyanobacteriota bacterium]HCB11661.1 hypothetical protein [Cyanobacteria bacterium UBA11991]